MDGYYNDPQATEKAMGDGWFHTGDAAVVHPDGCAPPAWMVGTDGRRRSPMARADRH